VVPTLQRQVLWLIRSIQFNAVVETNEAAVKLWHSLGFEVLTTVPQAFDHLEHGLVGLHVMFLDLTITDSDK
jgi:hypothetical protein